MVYQGSGFMVFEGFGGFLGFRIVIDIVEGQQGFGEKCHKG